MKKRIVALVMTTFMALSLAACGGKSTGGDGAGSAAKGSAGQESDKQSSSKESSALADWYAGKDRGDLEDIINNTFSDQGLTFFITIEEPDTIIYNYQYTEPLDLDSMTQEQINAYFDSSLNSAASTIQSDIKNYQDIYDIPLTTIRMVYLNTDGSEIYSMDITEDYVPTEGGTVIDPDASYASLEEWIASDEAALTVQATNAALESTGMTVDFGADGTVFIYEYTVSDDLGLSSLSKDDIKTAFDSTVETNRASVASVFSDFESMGIEVSAVRFAFYAEDGTELYSADVAKE